jgi:hypothetical protein
MYISSEEENAIRVQAQILPLITMNHANITYTLSRELMFVESKHHNLPAKSLACLKRADPACSLTTPSLLTTALAACTLVIAFALVIDVRGAGGEEP